MDIVRNNAAGLSGIEQLRAIVAADTPPPINATLGFALVELEEGRVVFEGHPGRSVYNPIGSVHGGYAATLLDSACGCAVHSRLSPEQGYTTLELKVAYHRPLTEESGPVRAEGRIVSMGRRTAFAEGRLTDRHGRLCATATSTLLVFPVERPPAAS
ncbi:MULTISPECIES: PaaI family thioesterase [unclassified Aureimonas]|uniref:PaaI family thioesterase n=1 Tax=unclassified Aureimonas TaxID=2615206 RepID=UPI0006F37C27|nr:MULTISPECIES: PaaI family thioesterase [unclassified Aureimonas]KQT66047.1 thioesterase [Aureimonas sp. Leaf427]KQT73414.1 thioesterase [Aureimonas sp. Leaf460]